MYFLNGAFDIWKWNSAREAEMCAVKNNMWAVRLQKSFVDHLVKSFISWASFYSSAMILTKFLYLDMDFFSTFCYSPEGWWIKIFIK